jgi:hypothetical protein
MAISFIKLNVPYRLLDSTADTYVMVDRVTSENIDVNTFVPKLSEVFFFPEENGYRAIKIGDGVNTLAALPFAGSADTSDLEERIAEIERKIEDGEIGGGEGCVGGGSSVGFKSHLGPTLEWSQYNEGAFDLNTTTPKGYATKSAYYFKVCSYDPACECFASDLTFRIGISTGSKTEFTRITINAQYPYQKGSDKPKKIRMMVVPTRMFFENGAESQKTINMFRLFEKAADNKREIWGVVETPSIDYVVSELHVNGVVSGTQFENIGLEQKTWGPWQGAEEGNMIPTGDLDSVNLTMANFFNKTFIGNIDSHATAEGASVLGGVDGGCIASGKNSLAGGTYTTATGNSSFAYGLGKASRKVTASGQGAVAMGYYGDDKYYLLTASGKGAIALGHGTVATEEGAIGVGHSSQSKGVGSFAAGYYAKATKQGAVAIGYDITADHKNAVAIGPGAYTGTEGQIVFGPYNKTDATSILVVGNGKDADSRSNVFTIGPEGTRSNVNTDGVTVEYADKTFVSYDDAYLKEVVWEQPDASSGTGEIFVEGDSCNLISGHTYYINGTKFTAVQASNGDDVWDYAAPPIGTAFYIAGQQYSVYGHDPSVWWIRGPEGVKAFIQITKKNEIATKEYIENYIETAILNGEW